MDEFLNKLSENQKEIVFYFYNYLVEEINLISKVRYKIPFFYNRSWICYLNPVKPDFIELAFTRGNELSNIQGLLNSKNRKQISGIEIQKLGNSDLAGIKEIIQEAILLDETIPYKSKNRKND